MISVVWYTRVETRDPETDADKNFESGTDGWPCLSRSTNWIAGFRNTIQRRVRWPRGDNNRLSLWVISAWGKPPLTDLNRLW
jgi:hypothetical protein